MEGLDKKILIIEIDDKQADLKDAGSFGQFEYESFLKEIGRASCRERV